LFFPRLLDRQYYQAWRDSAARSTEDRCRDRKEEILSTHSVEPVSDEFGKALDQTVAASRRQLSRR